jgi:hypothetical protein
MNDIKKIPSRIKYYLLDYKDRNMEDYLSEFGSKKVNDLSTKELKRFFELATNKDKEKIL